jgi:hypothetical protein
LRDQALGLRFRNFQTLGKRVSELLPRLRKAGIDQPEELNATIRRDQRIGNRLDPQHCRLDLWARIKRTGRHDSHDARYGNGLDRNGQKGQPPRPGDDPLGHLSLDHHHEHARRVRQSQKPQDYRRGDVVRQVGDQLVGPLEPLRRLEAHGIAGHNLDVPRHQT